MPGKAWCDYDEWLLRQEARDVPISTSYELLQDVLDVASACELDVDRLSAAAYDEYWQSHRGDGLPNSFVLRKWLGIIRWEPVQQLVMTYAARRNQ